MSPLRHRKYRQSVEDVEESKRIMLEAEKQYRANPNPETRYELDVAQQHWRRDVETRAKRDEEYPEE